MGVDLAPAHDDRSLAAEVALDELVRVRDRRDERGGGAGEVVRPVDPVVEADLGDGEGGPEHEPEERAERHVPGPARGERLGGHERRADRLGVAELRLLGDPGLLEVSLERPVELLAGQPLTLELGELDGLRGDALEVGLVLAEPVLEPPALGDEPVEGHALVGDPGPEVGGPGEPGRLLARPARGRQRLAGQPARDVGDPGPRPLDLAADLGHAGRRVRVAAEGRVLAEVGVELALERGEGLLRLRQLGVEPAPEPLRQPGLKPPELGLERVDRRRPHPDLDAHPVALGLELPDPLDRPGRLLIQRHGPLALHVRPDPVVEGLELGPAALDLPLEELAGGGDPGPARLARPGLERRRVEVGEHGGLGRVRALGRHVEGVGLGAFEGRRDVARLEPEGHVGRRQRRAVVAGLEDRERPARPRHGPQRHDLAGDGLGERVRLAEHEELVRQIPLVPEKRGARVGRED